MFKILKLIRNLYFYDSDLSIFSLWMKMKLKVRYWLIGRHSRVDLWLIDLHFRCFRILIMGQSTSTTSSGPALTASGHVYMNRYPWCKYLSYIRTLFGIITVFSKFSYINFVSNLYLFISVAFSAGIDALFSISGVPMGVYLITIAIPMFLLEFGKIVRMCCGFVSLYMNGHLTMLFQY